MYCISLCSSLNKAKDLHHSRMIPLGLKKEDYILRDLAMVLDEDTDEEEDDDEEEEGDDDDDEVANDIFDPEEFMDDSVQVGTRTFGPQKAMYL